MFGKQMLPDALSRAINTMLGGTGPGLPVPPNGKEVPTDTPANSPLILVRRYPSLDIIPPANKTGVSNKFILPLALMNDASQWVQNLFYTIPMPKSGAATSFPAAHMPGMIAAPLSISPLYGTELNLQTQLGEMGIQATELTNAGQNYG